MNKSYTKYANSVKEVISRTFGNQGAKVVETKPPVAPAVAVVKAVKPLLAPQKALKDMTYDEVSKHHSELVAKRQKLEAKLKAQSPAATPDNGVYNPAASLYFVQGTGRNYYIGLWQGKVWTNNLTSNDWCLVLRGSSFGQTMMDYMSDESDLKNIIKEKYKLKDLMTEYFLARPSLSDEMAGSCDRDTRLQWQILNGKGVAKGGTMTYPKPFDMSQAKKI